MALRKRRRIGIGIAGMGFMGTTHLLAARRLREAEVVALVTADPRKRRGDFRHVRGNFGAGAGRVDLGGLAVHSSLESMLQDPAVDLVDICLPSYLHARSAIASLAAGKHVLVEKPIALRAADARRMLAAARRAGKLLMVAQVLKFFPEFALLAGAIRDGRWGRLIALHLERRIARPDWGTGSWFVDPEKSGGMVVDLHIHDTDFIVHLFGKPRRVASHAVLNDGRVDFLRTAYLYGKGSPLLSAEAGWINAPSLPFQHGYEAFFERATLRFDSAVDPSPTFFAGKGAKKLKLAAADGFETEIDLAARAARAGKAPRELAAEVAAQSLAVCLAEERAARSGKPVAVS
jgi:predicted dehydrogenase